MQLHKLTRTGEPETGSREAPDDVGAATESVKHVGQVIRRDSDPFVTHDRHSGLAVGSVRCVHRDADRTAVGTELDGIAQHVGKHAMHPGLIHGGLESRRVGLEQELVQVRHELVLADRLAGERDQLRASEQQRQRVT